MNGDINAFERGKADKRDTRDVNFLLLAIVISGVTTFMFYPLMTLELLARGESPTAAGLILGLLSGTGRILSGVMGRINARFGSRSLAVGGLIIRSAGLLFFAVHMPTAAYWVGAILASIGSSATALALKTELMRSSASRKTITLRSIAVNIGALIGPSIGGLLYVAYSFSTIVWIVVSSYVFLAVLLFSLVRFQAAEEAETQRDEGRKAGVRWGIDKPFAWLLMCTFVYWAIYSQWNLVVPIYAELGFGTPLGSTWVFTGNAVFILALQYVIIVKLFRDVASGVVLGLGFISFALAFLMLFSVPTPASVVTFATAFSLAELLISPTLDEITARLKANGQGMTRAYGITAAVGGVASLVCATAGGSLIDSWGSPGAVGFMILPLVGAGIIGSIALKQKKDQP